MKRQTGISIAGLALASAALAFAAFNHSAANSNNSSTPIVVDGTGRQVPLDSLLPPGETGMIFPAAEQALAQAAPGSSPCVNINTADNSQLQELKGVGPAMSLSIIEHRAKFGPFGKKEDLMKVKGMGPAKFAAIADGLCL